MSNDTSGISGEVTVELHDKDGNLKHREVVKNLVTQVGDQLYGERGAGIGSPPAIPTGMKLGTGSTAVAKTGAGAALVTYLSNSHQAFDSTYPQSSLGSGRVITYKVTYAAGKATSPATAITECVIVNDTLADATSTAANTVARVLLSGIASKQSTDTLTVTWTHTLLGS
jgi:hypothetical protein